MGNQRKGLPGPERTTIEVNELAAGIVPHPAVLQIQCSPPNYAWMDTRDEKINRLPFDVETVTGCAPTAFHKHGIVLR